jgi:septal ring factor EnvC (AmiA/AmiB activator)
MSNDELERKMAFIVERQAHFASDIQQLREVQGQTLQSVARLANATLEGFKDVNTKINSLVDSQIRTDENFKHVNDKINSLVDSQIKLTDGQSRTDESRRNLIAVVDRYFSDGRNGR